MTNCTERSIGVSRFSAQRFLTPDEDIAFCLFRSAPYSLKHRLLACAFILRGQAVDTLGGRIVLLGPFHPHPARRIVRAPHMVSRSCPARLFTAIRRRCEAAPMSLSSVIRCALEWLRNREAIRGRRAPASRAVRSNGGIRSEMSVFIRSERRCGPRVAGILFLKTVSPTIGCQRHGLLVKRDHGPLARRAFTPRFAPLTTSWLHPKDG